ncbi:MAG: helix-turn-helix domain-containing protein [Candidatus Rokubacteria bacterium]|nr:helix-turn-helix domain-containing protein [Candidatus Rokubacteria bacterium]
MSSVGSYLRELRERHGVSVEEIARSTRVLHQYLDALEADDFAALPAPAFAKGFIRAYCQVLGESPEHALALWAERPARSAESGETRVPGRTQARAADTRSRGRGPVLVSFALLVVLGLALFVTTLALQSGRSVQPEPPAVAPAVEPRPAATPVPPASTPPEIRSVAPPYRLMARTTEATWLRVRTGDGRSSEETVPPGEVREWVSDRPFVLTIGNAGGVTFELNGRALPHFGKSGEVIARLVLPPDTQ